MREHLYNQQFIFHRSFPPSSHPHTLGRSVTPAVQVCTSCIHVQIRTCLTFFSMNYLQIFKRAFLQKLYCSNQLHNILENIIIILIQCTIIHKNQQIYVNATQMIFCRQSSHSKKLYSQFSGDIANIANRPTCVFVFSADPLYFSNKLICERILFFIFITRLNTNFSRLSSKCH